MMTPSRALRVAIVGAGPSGFYAAEALLKALPETRIDLLDRLPTPYGLVRGGVAPDHQKIKSVTRVFDRVATQPTVRYLGNVEVGRDIAPAELAAHYDAVIYAVGARADRRLGIPGEDLPGSHAATELVGWYNGHPDYRDLGFDLTQGAAAVIGLGNVAMDVTRILSRRPAELATSDIAAHAAAALADSRVRTVHVLGRRGPVQGAFTTPELRELGELPEVDVVVDPADLVLDPISAAIVEQGDDRTLLKNLEVLREWSTRTPTGAPRRIVFHFNVSPTAVLGSDHVTGIQLVRNRLDPDGRGGVRAVATDTTAILDVGLVFRSVGYRGVALDGLPFDAGRGVIPHRDGRVVEHEGSSTPLPGCYACGWIKRGPSGVIGTNKSCAVETVDALLADVAAERLPHPERGDEDLVSLLRGRGVRVTDWADWQRLDALETSRGAAAGKPREKLTALEEMLAALS
ncbi:MAG: FAD-dependent oxidoreductase [Gemmatimonadetes bacterium]|nr:FAD-dependent oxidoreductase [Gemmatimonadota bacterium]MCB9518893.1 FAD-dependent oxidoreductase [Gemmatimonadales bacterium]HPF62504.1 FAD-dependent oxidoreductase [Gemmatimonadales bacterium]HRX19265.1 FAD-dependent oxidoreductase [Gemmatimonadales bacterium]